MAVELVNLQLKVGISLSSNGRERMVVIGTVKLVRLQLKVGISPSSNARERIDVPGGGVRMMGLVMYMMQLEDAATQTCPII